MLYAMVYVGNTAMWYMYRLYNEGEGLSNIHDRGRSPRTCILDYPESREREREREQEAVLTWVLGRRMQ